MEHIRLASRLSASGKLVKTRDKGDKVLILQRKSNSRGCFIEVSMTPRIGMRHLIIPEDKDSWGWENLVHVLQSELMNEEYPAKIKPFVQRPLDFLDM